MKILAPSNSSREVKQLILAGADEIYCGMLTEEWVAEYGNVASANRREWKAANLGGFGELGEITRICHDSNVPVHLALNALYTTGQYKLVRKQLDQAAKLKIDAVIVADLGLFLEIKRLGLELDVHISTGATVFNSQAVDFFTALGASRIILPRHLRVDEIENIVQAHPAVKFEVFALNSGCRNIDGFCTFHHGVKELEHPGLWNIPKRLNFDCHFLNLVRRLPKGISGRLNIGVFGVDSACLLNYKISRPAASAGPSAKTERRIRNNIASSFSLVSGVDSCAVCRVAEFSQIGVFGLKIVGRNYSTAKKARDIRFLKAGMSLAAQRPFQKEEFRRLIRAAFRRIYKMDCGELCYYPDGMGG